jgi:acid phosphatase family membrane protein YuiD
MKITMAATLILVSCLCAIAQETAGSIEKRVSLTETAVALDGSGAPALEATLKTTALNGAADSPVTNIRLLVKNSSAVAFAFVSGVITFYDGTGVRCGESVFKADALSVSESF